MCVVRLGCDDVVVRAVLRAGGAVGGGTGA